MTKIFCQVYYICLSYLVLDLAPFFITPQKTDPVYISFAHILSWIALPAALIYPSLLALTLVFLFLAFYNGYRAVRILASLFILVYFSAYYSFGKINHVHHIWLVSALFIPFFNFDQTLNSTKNIYLLRFMQSLLLCPYFCSGLWKLRDGIFSTRVNLLAVEKISYSLLEGNHIPNFIYELLLIKHPEIAGYGLLIFILLQLSTIIPILYQKGIPFWGLAIVVFHLSNGFILGIWFTKTILGAMLFFIWLDVLLETELKIFNSLTYKIKH